MTSNITERRLRRFGGGATSNHQSGPNRGQFRLAYPDATASASLWPAGQIAVGVDLAAKALGLSEEVVRRLLRGKELRGRKVGTVWIISVDALHEFVNGTRPARAAS